MISEIYETSRCGHLLSPLISNVSTGSICHECGRYGFLASEPAFLYLATNIRLAQHKVGIANVVNGMDHIKSLLADGWSIYGAWHSASKRQTFIWEKALFQVINTPGAMGEWVGGWARDINATVVSAASIAREAERIIGKAKK